MNQSWKEFRGLFTDVLSNEKFNSSLLGKKFLSIKKLAHAHGTKTSITSGHCYIVSEAAYYMLGGKEEGWKPMFIKHLGAPHWFLKHESGFILDLTSDQFQAPIEYKNGRGKGFMTKQPCKRTKILMKKIRDNIHFINEQNPDLDSVIEGLIVKGQHDAPRILAKLGLLNENVAVDDYDVRDWNQRFYVSLYPSY